MDSSLMPNKPYAFLSSICRDSNDIRKRAYELINNGNYPLRLHVDEIDAHLTIESIHGKDLQIVDSLSQKITDASIVIVILCNPPTGNAFNDNSGTLVINSEVSFLEIELYHAASLKKPTFVIVEKGFDTKSRPSLDTLLNILPFFAENRLVVEREKIPQTILKIILEKHHSTFLNLKKFLIQLNVHRSTEYNAYYQMYDSEISSRKYQPLIRAGEPNIGLVKEMMTLAKIENNYARKISRLYLAYREMLKVPYWQKCDTELLMIWLELTVDMRNALCWYGAHGHLNLGMLQHLTDFGSILTELKNHNKSFSDLEQFKWKYVYLSSEYYSLYTLIGGGHLQTAMKNISLGLSSGGDWGPLMSIRGACFLRMYKFQRAIEDFEELLKYIENKNVDVNEVADLLVTLGHAYFLGGRFAKGFDLATKGIEMFTANDGFKVRALRKISQMYKLTFRLGKANKYLEEAEQLGKNIGANGQLRQIHN